MNEAKEETKMVPITIHAEVPEFVAEDYRKVMEATPEGKQPDLRSLIVVYGVQGAVKQLSKIALISILEDLL